MDNNETETVVVATDPQNGYQRFLPILISVGTLIVNVVIAIAVLLQLQAVNDEVRRDHERRRKQATLETMAPRIREAREFLENVSSKEIMTDEELSRIIENPKVKSIIDKALGA